MRFTLGKLVATPGAIRLMARLDKLIPVKEVAQIGAAIGREFSQQLMAALSPMDEVELNTALDRLVASQLVYRRGSPPKATYIFKHALIQDAAYGSVLKRDRQNLHKQIAETLLVILPATADHEPELLAHHFTEGGLHKQAILYWKRAGHRAIERSAHAEAISHLTKGLEVIETMPDTRERTLQELDLQTILGSALLATKGYAGPEVERVYARAHEIGQQIGETPQLVPVLQGLCLFHLNRGELEMARALGEQLLKLTQNVQDPNLHLTAHAALGTTLFWVGEFVLSREHLEQSIALYDRRQRRVLHLDSGHDTGTMCRFYRAYVLWFLGYPNQALQQSHEAGLLAQELAHPFSLAYALGSTSAVHQWRREAQAAQEQAEAALVLAREQAFPYWLNIGTIRRGWALAMQGQIEEGIQQLRQGWAQLLVTGTYLSGPWVLAQIAEALGKAGEVEEALTVVADALATVGTTSNHFYEAELYRLKGELLLRQEAHWISTTEAEICFQQSITIARDQQAKSWELRAATSLGRLWQSQDKHQDAYDLLAPVYNWFTEGFDTADLQEAKSLLDVLSS